MNATKKAQLVLGTFAIGMTFFSIAPKPADSLIPVSVDLDVTATTIAAAQATQRTGIATAAHVDSALQYAKQILQWQQEIKELTAAGTFLSAPRNMAQLTNQVVILNNQNPTSAGTQLAKLLVSAQNGSLGPSDLAALQNEGIAAIGNLGVGQAAVDGEATDATAIVQNTQLQASLETQRAADLNLARIQRPQVLDVAGSSTYNGGNGGFSARGINDYSNGSVF